MPAGPAVRAALTAVVAIGCVPVLLFIVRHPSSSMAEVPGSSRATEKVGGSDLNPHGNLVFKVTDAKTCADCHRIGSATREHLEILDNAMVRSLIARGKGAHTGRFADCFRCHTSGRLGVEKYMDPSRTKP